MSEHVYVDHRYGHHNGAIKFDTKGGSKYRSTDDAMLDKARYNETRFSGERNVIHSEEGVPIEGGYKAAYAHTRAGADRVAATNTSGRSRGRAYVYDTTVNPGVGRLSDEAAHRLGQAFAEELRARGYRVEGYHYTVHQNTDHTHLHVMFASHKTIQRPDLNRMSTDMRRHVSQEQEREQTREHVHEASYDQELDRGVRR